MSVLPAASAEQDGEEEQTEGWEQLMGGNRSHRHQEAAKLPRRTLRAALHLLINQPAHLQQLLPTNSSRTVPVTEKCNNAQ